MVTTFRALIMLAVLVGLPGAWIYYGPLPEGAQRVVDRVVGVAKEAFKNTRGSSQATKPAWSEATPAPAWTGQPTPTIAASVASPSTAPRYVSMDSADVNQTSPARSSAPATELATPPTFAERVEPMLVKLRQLGAAEYAMERWGARGELYRFRCEMPLTASNAMTQQFEAVAADPQATVEQVVAEVTSWRLARQGGEVITQ